MINNTKEIEYMQALAEISYILKYTDSELVKKIPNKFLEHIENKKDKNYIVNIDNRIPLEKQVLKEKTKKYMEENNTEMAIMDYKNIKWYKKVINKIKNWFKTILNK